MLFSAPAMTGELQPVMKSIGAGFKATFKNASRGINSEEAKLIVLNLKNDIEKASGLLPEGVNPGDTEIVARYQAMMQELFEKSILLEDSFSTNPLDKMATIGILKEMDALRKKGHAVFK
ncbi:MAG: hypothetical protein ACJAT2_002122 [Bacteriovoracaceae bacterium]|jgi:hypothetical protein